jgi:hypothetical protein
MTPDPIIDPATPAPKPLLSSVTVWSGIGAILSGLSTLALVYGGAVGADAIAPAITGILSGIGAIIGRLKAVRPIG